MTLPHGIRSDDPTVPWSLLCSLALEVCGSQAVLKKEIAILKRLVKQFGATDVERMLRGALHLKWNTLRSLGSAEGIGRRWALEAFWQREKNKSWKPPEALSSIFAKWGGQ